MDKEPKQKLIKDFVKSEKALREAGAIRSGNIVADYAEYLVCETFRLERAKGSQKGFDAKDQKGNRVQIKSRWMRSDKSNASNSELGSLGTMETKGFDYLIAVLFDDKLMIDKALKIPYRVAKEKSKTNRKDGKHILRLNDKRIGELGKDKGAEDIKFEFPKWCKT